MEVGVLESPDLISSEVRDWVVNIGKELEQRRPRRARNKNGALISSVFRVPPHLLKFSRESYTPKVFSFGLFDLHERKISRLDDHRYELASSFKDIVGIRRWSRVCGKLVGNSVMILVGLYDDLEVVLEKDLETVTNLLCLDAVFVVCFIQGRHQALCNTCRDRYPIINDVIQREPLWSRRSLVLFDIFLFQNQIPLELISNVVDLMSITEKTRLRQLLSNKSGEGSDPLHKMVVDAVEMVYSNLPGFLVLRETTQKTSFGECKHLLHCLYNVICYDPKKSIGETPQQVENEKTHSIPVSSTPAQNSSPLPSETPDLRTESQGGKDLVKQSSSGRKDLGNHASSPGGSVAPPPTQEIIEDAQRRGLGNVSFNLNQAERVNSLFRGEDMARLFSPENRLGDGKKKVEEREFNHGSLERNPQQPENVADTPAMNPAATGQPAAPLPVAPVPTSLNAAQQGGNSMASSNTAGRALSQEKESPSSKTEGQATPAAHPRRSQAGDPGFRVVTPDGHSSRREFFGSQGKEKIVAHRLPEPVRGPPGSSLSTLRPWIASPRIFGDGSAWSIDSEPSSPRSQLSSRPASDRKSNLAVAQEIGHSNLQVVSTPDAEKPKQQERSSPRASRVCNRNFMEPGEQEDKQNRRVDSSVSEWFLTLKCGGDSSPPPRSPSEWAPGFDCKDNSDKARSKRRRPWAPFLFGCMMWPPSQARPSEVRSRIDHIPALTQLKKVGIHVAVGTTRYISEVTFKRRSGFQGTLYLPAFDVLEETEGLIRNLLTYEHVVEKKNDLLSYIHLMYNLIDTEEDVELLMQRGAIRANSLGSNKAVADMWRTLPSGYVMTLSPQYQDLYEKISDHCSRINNARFEEFRKLYLARPWLVGLLIFVIVVFLLTLISTMVATAYTVVTYYQGNN